ncbi:MAG: Dehydrogenase [Caulobacteraceae bacterium]|jgi:NAD(P)-dependent dehydrogenase (short-subunit alcohol dehydrogenase family)|nr:Dehydrogenase [Caulobacteraceae bacterium]
MGRVQDKVALVTGGASGIGAACATALAREGAAVVLTDLQDDKGAALVEAIARSGGRARYLHHDVTSEEAWVGVIAEVKSAYGRLDILVNNAGIGIASPSITTMSLKDFRRQQAVNVEGVFLGVKHGLAFMREAGHGGSIVNISSVAGLKGSPTLAAYSATKGAVRLLSKAVALECAAARDGVRVNSVHPGIIETPIWLGIVPDGSGSNAGPDLDALSAMAVPVGVKGLPDDIANGVVWLASEESRYVTGTELVIDGGLTAR